MLSRQDYERIIEIFFVELNHLCLNASENDLRALPRLATEIDGYLKELRDPENDAGQVLRYAFAYLDEYRGADWNRIVSTGYEAYKIAQSKPAGGATDA